VIRLLTKIILSYQSYHDLAVKTLYVWDRDYLSRMPPRRDDGSIFLSIATYRDENCLNTISQAYKKSQNPDKLFIGLVQQNCHSNCRSGVLEGGKMEDVEPDQDCYKAFCESEEGKQICDNDQVRLLDIDEPESLGPYAARFFASKLWYGEEWFMQTDAHMTFKQDWDAISVSMLKAAPSKKPVISHYPPSHMADLEAMADRK
jgi:[Skp1-protein]-hydroxyproline N-acetylglucosaminyltransferase